MKSLREHSLEIFRYALQKCEVGSVIERRVCFRSETISVDDEDYSMDQYERILVVALGKAAEPMVSTFLRLAGGLAQRMEVIVSGTGTVPNWPPNVRAYCGGHPAPNQASFDAGSDILATLHSAGTNDLVVFLISGGGSAMVEQPLLPGSSLEHVVAIHKALVESGAPIRAINTIRKHLSAVKGGRLAAAAAPATQLTLFVSDVPEGQLDALSSGPTLPDPSYWMDAARLLQEYGLETRLPAEVTVCLSSGGLPETPKPGDAVFDRSMWHVLLDSATLEQAAALRAIALGWHVEIDHRCDDWTADDAAAYLVDKISRMRERQERVCLISGGEVTVRLPASGSGVGGRNQHFALLCAQRIVGREMCVLSCGSDGMDGNSPAAGAMVDGNTMLRAEQAGYSLDQTLARFDSHSLLSLLGDTVVTGPSGTNVRDLRVLLAP